MHTRPICPKHCWLLLKEHPKQFKAHITIRKHVPSDSEANNPIDLNDCGGGGLLSEGGSLDSSLRRRAAWVGEGGQRRDRDHECEERCHLRTGNATKSMVVAKMKNMSFLRIKIC